MQWRMRFFFILWENIDLKHSAENGHGDLHSQMTDCSFLSLHFSLKILASTVDCSELKLRNMQEFYSRLSLHNGDKKWWEAVFFLKDGLTVFGRSQNSG